MRSPSDSGSPRSSRGTVTVLQTRSPARRSSDLRVLRGASRILPRRTWLWPTGQDSDTVVSFVEAIKKLPQVTECHLMAGDCDFILRVVVADRRLSQIPDRAPWPHQGRAQHQDRDPDAADQADDCASGLTRSRLASPARNRRRCVARRLAEVPALGATCSLMSAVGSEGRPASASNTFRCRG